MSVSIFAYKMRDSELGASNPIAKYFDCEVFHYQTACKLEQALRDAIGNCVVLIDIEERLISDLDLTSRISKLPNVTVIFFASKSRPEERVRWLSFGASAYIKKPFLVEEVFLRAKRISFANQKGYVEDSNFTIDFRKRKSLYLGKEIKLTNKMLDVLVYFIENEGQILPREKIMNDVFGTHYYLSDRNVDTIIKEIRKKTHSQIIETVRGRGYIYSESNSNIDSIVE